MNPINKVQKWMDTMAGQTFMQYAYSWGAAIVILGTLFKLIHWGPANEILCIGMGTEVFVFIISGFERVTEKVNDSSKQEAGKQILVAGGSPLPDGAEMSEGHTIVIGGSSPVSASANIDPEALAAGAGLSAAAANLAAAGQAAAQAQLALGQIQNGGPAIDPAQISATDPAAIEEAVKNYAEELTELTEVLGRVKKQAERMSTDSEEMENLNRTLTGIATVYELQLRNISKQVSTIEQIDEQTRRMADQIQELNNVYARMIGALTINMGGNNSQTNV